MVKFKHNTREDLMILAFKRVEAGESPEEVIKRYSFYKIIEAFLLLLFILLVLSWWAVERWRLFAA